MGEQREPRTLAAQVQVFHLVLSPALEGWDVGEGLGRTGIECSGVHCCWGSRVSTRLG